MPTTAPLFPSSSDSSSIPPAPADASAELSYDDVRADETTHLLQDAGECSGEKREHLLADAVALNLEAADRAARRYRSRGVSDEDLVQVARLGLVKAAHRFDPERGCPFLSFALPTMLGELRRYFRDKAWSVRPPRRLQELQSELAKLSEECLHEKGRPATIAELADLTGRERAEVGEALGANGCFQPRSLDWTTDDGVAVSDVVGVEERGFAHAEDQATLSAVLEKLSPRDQRLVYLRFHEDRTQAEIADEFGVTQMQISRLLKRVLERMRSELVAA